MACPCSHRALPARAPSVGPLVPPRCALVSTDRAHAVGPVDSPLVVYRVLSARSLPLKREKAWILLLTPEKLLRVESEIGRGTSDEVEIDLDWALACARTPERTPYAILAHNHPSGSAWPSEADARLTGEMGGAAARQGLELLDHVVLGRGEIFSFHLRQLLRIP